MCPDRTDGPASDCVLVAEHEVGPRTDVRIGRWHVACGAAPGALCGLALEPDAEVGPVSAVDQAPPERVCAACWGRYRALAQAAEGRQRSTSK